MSEEEPPPINAEKQKRKVGLAIINSIGSAGENSIVELVGKVKYSSF